MGIFYLNSGFLLAFDRRIRRYETNCQWIFFTAVRVGKYYLFFWYTHKTSGPEKFRPKKALWRKVRHLKVRRRKVRNTKGPEYERLFLSFYCSSGHWEYVLLSSDWWMRKKLLLSSGEAPGARLCDLSCGGEIWKIIYQSGAGWGWNMPLYGLVSRRTAFSFLQHRWGVNNVISLPTLRGETMAGDKEVRWGWEWGRLEGGCVASRGSDAGREVSNG